MIAVGVAALLAAAAAPGRTLGAPPGSARDVPDNVVVARPSTVDVVHVAQGRPAGFEPIATRQQPNGSELDPTIDIVWLGADGTRLLLDHLDGACSTHVSTDVAEHEDRVAVTLVDEVETPEPAELRATITVCQAVGFAHRSGVELASPLGSRRLVVDRAVVEVPPQDG